MRRLKLGCAAYIIPARSVRCNQHWLTSHTKEKKSFFKSGNKDEVEECELKTRCEILGAFWVVATSCYCHIQCCTVESKCRTQLIIAVLCTHLFKILSEEMSLLLPFDQSPVNNIKDMWVGWSWSLALIWKSSAVWCKAWTRPVSSTGSLLEPRCTNLNMSSAIKPFCNVPVGVIRFISIWLLNMSHVHYLSTMWHFSMDYARHNRLAWSENCEDSPVWGCWVLMCEDSTDRCFIRSVVRGQLDWMIWLDLWFHRETFGNQS